MTKQLLFLFAIATLLSACKQIEEPKYTARKWDSITKAKHENEFDSVLAAYKKLVPEDSFYLQNVRKNQVYLISKNIINTGMGSLTIEHWDYSRVCSKKHFLYVYNDRNKSIVRLPDLDKVAYKQEILSRFESDFNTLIRVFKIKYLSETLICQYLYVIPIDRLDAPSLASYENQILKNSLCSKECRQNISEQMKIVRNNLQDNSYKVYRYGLYFLSVKINETTNITTYHFELVNPKCYCTMCF